MSHRYRSEGALNLSKGRSFETSARGQQRAIQWHLSWQCLTCEDHARNVSSQGVRCPHQKRESLGAKRYSVSILRLPLALVVWQTPSAIIWGQGCARFGGESARHDYHVDSPGSRAFYEKLSPVAYKSYDLLQKSVPRLQKSPLNAST